MTFILMSKQSPVLLPPSSQVNESNLTMHIAIKISIYQMKQFLEVSCASASARKWCLCGCIKGSLRNCCLLDSCISGGKGGKRKQRKTVALLRHDEKYTTP